MSNRIILTVLFLALVLCAACTAQQYTWTITLCDGTIHVVSAGTCSMSGAGRVTCWPSSVDAPAFDAPDACGLVRGE